MGWEGVGVALEPNDVDHEIFLACLGRFQLACHSRLAGRFADPLPPSVQQQ